MTQTLGYVALVVREYDEAIAFFTERLGFELVEDSVATDRLGQEKRWVLVAPPHSFGTKLLLARASTPEEESRIGNQTAGRVFLFLHTDDFWRDYRAMTSNGVKFCQAPREEAYGTVVVFEDLYGNLWDLLELKQTADREHRSSATVSVAPRARRPRDSRPEAGATDFKSPSLRLLFPLP